MIKETISTERARRLYDWIGARYDWAEFYESKAKRCAQEMLSLAPGDCFLNIGVGTGKEHLEFSQEIGPSGLACGIDLSPVMARLAHSRTGAPIVEADTCFLPFRPQSFDVIYAAYVFDLIAAEKIPGILAQCYNLLAPGGRLVLLSLTEGVNLLSRSLVAGWKFLFSLAPIACGGCRPLVLSAWVEAAGFGISASQTVVQGGVPSEIIHAERRETNQDAG